VLTTSVTLARLVGSVRFGFLWTTRSMVFAMQVFAGALIVALVTVALVFRTLPEEPAE
jgi:hypothetical protein